MPPVSPPPLEELQAAASRALAHLDGADGQVCVLWERIHGTRGERSALTATFTVVDGGRAATATTDDLEGRRLARAAKAAVVNARRARAWPAPALPDPAPVVAHEGWDDEALGWAPPARDGLAWQAAAARVVIASTRGVRAAEQRTHVRAELRCASAAAVGPSALDLEALAGEAAALEGVGGAPSPPPDQGELVLGPAAVAALIDHLRPAFGVHLDIGGGPLAGRLGTRVAAPGVTLSDCARHPDTLPRSFDAEGVAREPVVLIEDGVARGRVHDSASAAREPGTRSTGHATRAAALAPLPEHLVLEGGTEESVEALCTPIRDGLFVPALTRGADGRHETRGAVRIRDGRLAAPVADHPVVLDSLATLASVEALTASRRLVALPGHTPGGAGAALVPALRAGGGLRPSAG